MPALGILPLTSVVYISQPATAAPNDTHAVQRSPATPSTVQQIQRRPAQLEEQQPPQQQQQQQQQRCRMSPAAPPHRSPVHTL